MRPMHNKMWWQQARDEKPTVSIADLEISLDKGTEYHYVPGELLQGQIQFNVWQATDMYQLAIWIQGQGSLKLATTSTVESAARTETYLEQRLVLMGSMDHNKSLILQPGPYTVPFHYRLPTELPPSVEYENKGRYTINITYKVVAEICDKIWNIGQYRYPSDNAGAELKFTVANVLDVTPESQLPVHISEPVENGQVSARLEKSGYRAGETVNLHLQTTGKKQWTILKIEMKEVTKTRDDKIISTIVTQEANLPNSPEYGCMIPIPHNALHSLLEQCRLVTVTHFLKLSIKFDGCQQQTKIKIPLTIWPSHVVVVPTSPVNAMPHHTGMCKFSMLKKQTKLNSEERKILFFDKDGTKPKHHKEKTLAEWLSKVARKKVSTMDTTD